MHKMTENPRSTTQFTSNTKEISTFQQYESHYNKKEDREERGGYSQGQKVVLEISKIKTNPNKLSNLKAGKLISNGIENMEDEMLLEDLEDGPKCVSHNTYTKDKQNFKRHLNCKNNQKQVGKTKICQSLEYIFQATLKNQNTMYCKEHKDKKLELICLDCCLIICPYCVIFQKNEDLKRSCNSPIGKQSHKTHKILSIQEFLKDFNRTIQQSEQFTNKEVRVKNINKLEDKIDSNRKQVEEILKCKFERTKTKVQQKINSLITKLKQSQKQLIQNLKQHYDSLGTKFNKINQEVKQNFMVKQETKQSQQIGRKIHEISSQIQKFTKINGIKQKKGQKDSIGTINSILKIFYGEGQYDLPSMLEKGRLKSQNMPLKQKLEEILKKAKQQEVNIKYDENLEEKLNQYATLPSAYSLQTLDSQQLQEKSFVYFTPSQPKEIINQSKNNQVKKLQDEELIDNSFITGFQSTNYADKSILFEQSDIKLIGEQSLLDATKTGRGLCEKNNQLKLAQSQLINTKTKASEKRINNCNNDFQKANSRDMLMKGKSLDIFSKFPGKNFKMEEKHNSKSPQKIIAHLSPPPRIVKSDKQINQQNLKGSIKIENLKPQKKSNDMKLFQSMSLDDFLLDSSINEYDSKALCSNLPKIKGKYQDHLQKQTQKQLKRIIQEFVQTQTYQQQGSMTSIQSPRSARPIKKHTSSTILDLSKLSLNDEQIKQILRTIYVQYKKPIKYLNLSYNQLTDVGFNGIVEYLSSINNINLSNNLLTAKILNLIIMNKDKLAPLRLVNLNGNIIKKDKKVNDVIENLKKMGISVNI